MERDGELTQSKKGRYTLADTAGSVRGRILSLNKSFGFARLEETGEDCFIAGRYLGDALPGDTVAIRIGAPDSAVPRARSSRCWSPALACSPAA